MTAISDESGIHSLIKNLKLAEIKVDKSIKDSIIHYSPADEKLNELAYEKVNKIFLEIIQQIDYGDYIHITGEMKALADPLHRNCIRELYLQHKQQFRIIFSLPSNYQISAHSIKKYNKEKWKDRNWVDHIDAFDILAENRVSIFNKYEREKSQYSLFGENLILFQSKHSPEQYIKEVWILESQELFKKLKKRAELIFSSSQFISPMIFTQFNSFLSTNSSLHLLFFLYDNKGNVSKADFLKELKKIEVFSDLNLDPLKTMDFIEEYTNSVKLKEDGKDFLKLFI